VNVDIGAQPDQHASLETNDNNASPVGMALAPLTRDQHQELGIDSSVQGALVAQVTPGSRADQSGVQAGDVIVRVGNEVVTSPGDASAKIHAAEQDKKEAVPLLVMRDGATYYLALQLGKA
jgi:serine protease Do